MWLLLQLKQLQAKLCWREVWLFHTKLAKLAVHFTPKWRVFCQPPHGLYRVSSPRWRLYRLSNQVTLHSIDLYTYSIGFSVSIYISFLDLWHNCVHTRVAGHRSPWMLQPYLALGAASSDNTTRHLLSSHMEKLESFLVQSPLWPLAVMKKSSPSTTTSKRELMSPLRFGQSPAFGTDHKSFSNITARQIHCLKTPSAEAKLNQASSTLNCPKSTFPSLSSLSHPSVTVSQPVRR